MRGVLIRLHAWNYPMELWYTHRGAYWEMFLSE